MNTKMNISPLQLLVLYMVTSFGAGIQTLPRSVGSVAREDMWLAVIVSGLAMGFSLWCAIALSRRFPEMTLLEYQVILLGPVLGQVLNGYYLLNMISIGAAALRSFTISLKLFLFDLTPPWILVFVFLVVAAYAGQYGIAPLIRMQQFVVLSIGPAFVGLALLGLLQIELKQFQPFLAEGFLPVLKGVVPGWFAYSGSELITGLLFPFITVKKPVLRTGLVSVGILMTGYTVMTVIVQGILGVEDTVAEVIPTIIAYREVDIPDTFVERIDGYLLIVHIALYFLSLANFLYFSAFALSQLLKLEYSRPVIILLVPVFYLIATLPQTVEQLNWFFRLVNYSSFLWGILILPVLLLIAKLRNVEENRNDK